MMAGSMTAGSGDGVLQIGSQSYVSGDEAGLGRSTGSLQAHAGFVPSDKITRSLLPKLDMTPLSPSELAQWQATRLAAAKHLVRPYTLPNGQPSVGNATRGRGLAHRWVRRDPPVADSDLKAAAPDILQEEVMSLQQVEVSHRPLRRSCLELRRAHPRELKLTASSLGRPRLQSISIDLPSKNGLRPVLIKQGVFVSVAAGLVQTWDEGLDIIDRLGEGSWVGEVKVTVRAWSLLLRSTYRQLLGVMY